MAGRGKGFVSAVLASAVFVAYAAVGTVVPAARAHAVNPPDALATGLSDWFTYLGGLADKGPLGSDLTGTTLDVGGANGLDLAGLATKINSQSWASASSVSDVASALDGMDGTIGAWHFDTSASTTGNGLGVTVQMQVTRTVDVGLSLADPSTSPAFDLSSPSGVSATLTAQLDFTVERDNGSTVWIDHTDTSPSFTIGVSASIPDLSKITGGLGILGISLGAGSSFSLTGEIETSFADPNGDGKLTFANPAELTASGSAGGVAVPAIKAGGSLFGTLVLAGQSSSLLAGLPDLSATVQVSSTDLASGKISASFSSNAFDAVKPFLTLETKDLATALAQLASALQTTQRTKDLPLPLLKGSAADAIQAAQSVEAFLKKYVQQPPTGSDVSDPTKYVGTGHPLFSSLQDLIGKLSNYTDSVSGASISLGANDAQYDTSDSAKPKIRLTLHLSNHASASTALDVVGPALTGSGPDVKYGPCTQNDHSDCYLEDDSKTFTADLAGRQVTAGTSTALIDSVNGSDSHKLMLSATPFSNVSPAPLVLWQGGGVPSAQTAYSISGADPRTGQVQMADALKGGSGLVSVNASVPQATITPHYDVTLPMVLDLEPSVSVPPTQVNNPDGTTSIITAKPTLAERIMLHTGADLLAGDLPISTAVDATAKVGFLQVHVGGTLKLCTNAPGVGDDCSGAANDGTSFVSISTKQVGDAGHDLALPDLFDMLAHHPGDLLTASFNGRAYGSLELSVPGQDGFFSGGKTTATLKWTDISNPATLSFTGPDLSQLLSMDISGLDDPTKLFGALLKALQALDSSLHAGGSGNTPLDTKLPLIGKSVHDLLGGVEQGGPGTHYTTTTMKDDSRDFTGYEGRRLLIGSATEMITGVSQDGHTVTVSPAFSNVPADGTSYAIGDALLAELDKLAANPSSSLNDMVAVLNSALHDDVNFAVQPAANNNPAYLKLTVDWARTFPLRVPLKFDLSIPNVPSSILGTSGKGTIDITAKGEIKVTLLFPLTATAIADPLGNLLVDPSSGAHVTLDVHSQGVSLAANLGPLALSVGDPNNPNDPGTQIEGKLGFALSGPGGNQPQTLSQFFSGLSVSADRKDDVTCNGVTGSNLALCANLPLYYKDTSSNTWKALGTGVQVHVPQPPNFDINQLSSYVDLPDGTTILNALASQLIDLSSLGDGLAGYLKLLNAALALADTAGKLPVVGPDIQQGLDFINGIKNAIETVIPVDKNDGTQQITDSSFLQTKLDDVATQLKTSLSLPTLPHFYVSTTCNATLDAATNLRDSGSANPSNGTVHYKYRVVAQYNSQTGNAPPSNEVDLQNKAAPLDASNFNQIQWDASTWATKYLVERDDGSGWKELATVQAPTTTYKDDGTDTPGAVDSSTITTAPTLNPCPGSAITGFKIKVVIGQGTVGSGGCTGNDCVQASSRPLDLGLPGLSLSTTDPDHPNNTAGTQVSASVGWELHLSFGLTKDKGFVVFTQDNDSDPNNPNQSQSTPELAIGAALTAPQQFNGRLAFLNIQAKDTQDQGNATTHRQFAGAFSVDLHGANDQPCPVSGCALDTSKVLTPDDFAASDFGSLVTAKLEASVSLHYQLTVRSTEALPGIRTDFHLDWSWATGSNPDKTSGLSLGFDDVRINPGSLLLGVLGPIFKQINAVYGPIKPVLDTVSAPLPVLSDLSHLAGGGDVSILTLAAAFANGTGNSATFDEFIKIFKAVKSVLDIINSVSNACSSADPSNYDNDANFCIHIGSFDLDSGFTFNTTLTPDTADGGITNPQPNATSAFDQINSDVQSDTGSNLDAATTKEATSGDKNACGAKKDDRGFTFPALTKPASLFGLVMGKDVELVCFDSGPLSLGFTMSEAFGPVYAPPPVLIVLSGSASVSVHIAAGFDTFGIRKAVEDKDAGVLGRAVDFLDSLYFKTTDTDGKPIPVLQFQGSIAAGAEVSAVIISVGVEGGISLTVSFYWNDPDNDGKFRFSEFLATALTNPICLFNVGGELDLFLKVFVTIGFSPFSISFDFTLVNIKLLDFSLKPDCTPPPPELGGKAGGTLYLFAGHLGTSALRGDNAWDNHGTDDEKVVVRQHKDDAQTVTVQMLGISEDFTGVTKVVLDGTNYGGKIDALFQGDSEGAVYDRPTVIVGGNNDDTVKTGSGPVWIDGGGGKDLIVTGDRPDLAADPATNTALVAGGSEDDSITVGNANDRVYGDGNLQIPTGSVGLTLNTKCNGNPCTASATSLDVSNTDNINPPSDGNTGTGNDRIAAGLGHDSIWGGGGDDTIGVAADSPLAATHQGDSHYVSAGVTVHGGPGSDLISTGSGNDVVFTGDTFDPSAMTQDAIADRNASGDAGTTNTVDTGTGTDTVYGGNGADVVTGHSDAATVDTFYGGPAGDILMGGYGKDQLWGGQDDDYLIAEPSTVGAPGSTSDVLGAARSVTHTPTTATPQPKLLVGGGGHDRIYGGDATSKIYGDHRDFTCSDGRGGADPSSDPPSEGGVGSDDASDLILGGAGVDDINAGGGNDTVFAKGADDFVCGSAGNDTIDAGAGADRVWGGTGNDTVYGSSGADHLYGNADDDTIYGGDQNDVIEGNNGKDTLFGGVGDDLVVGGTRASGKPDTDAGHLGDTLFGDTGNDVLIGDNGTAGGTRGGLVYDLDQVGTNLGEGDHIYGGDGTDAAYGGLGGDVIDLGDGNDYAEGNPGIDTISGDAGADDIVGGSSQAPGDPAAKDASGYPDDGDIISGGTSDDVIAGDNAIITDTNTVAAGDTVMQGRNMSVGRHVVLLDLGYTPTAGTSGGDTITGGDASDVVYGQGGTDTIHGNAGDDYVEGGQGVDTIYGDAGQDDLVGGSVYAESGSGQATAGQLDTGDVISGGADADVILGDNGLVTRDNAVPPSPITQGRTNTDGSADAMTLRAIQPYDLGDTPTANTSGNDEIHGDTGSDAILGQSGNDRILGGDDADYAEGGPGRDWVEGNAGDDDLIGGSSTIVDGTSGDAAQGQPDTADAVYGGTGDDLITGDNAVIDRAGTPSRYLFRIGSSGQLETQRALRLLDLKWGADYLTPPTRNVSGGDQLSGGAGVDVIFGQDGNDLISGGAGDDYAEGNGDTDTIYGDRTLADLGVTPTPPQGGWPGSASGEVDTSAPNGQDDLIGGSSIQAFRDANDAVHGDGGADFILGDNGTAVRDLLDSQGNPVTTVADALAAGQLTNRVYMKRYDSNAVPLGAAYVRHAATAGTGNEFCTDAQPTCEPVGAFGGDDLWGDAGDDTIYGQDGLDHIYGDTGSQAKPLQTPLLSVDDGGTIGSGSNDDDLYGGLGDDVMFGESGQDAMVGDRGGIVDVFQNGSNHFTIDLNQVPQIHYEGFNAGTVTRQVDLQHVVYGDTFAGAGSDAAIPHRGDLEGGNDLMLGGRDHDSMHGGFGDDLMNGDSGGDTVYGDDGADVLWGGKGCDVNIDQSTPDCLTNGTFDPNARGTNDRMVDYLFGGKGATSGPSVDPNTGDLGADVIDWHPRGSLDTPGTTCTNSAWPETGGTKQDPTVIDPCLWFIMTDHELGDDATFSQHHQGIDWQYGGWDRDIMQADVADNGPNQGDRLLDWTGAYNLYTHCNAAYGGFNDVRQRSPQMQSFLQQFAWSTGAGQASGDVTTAGTSAYDELALVYPADNSDHGSGSAFPSTPGHFDSPNACAP